MKKTLVLASSNAHKLKEIREILTEFNVVSCKEAGFFGDIEENGKTFYENALIKAKTVSEALGVPALGDDSGLSVDTLGGAPGIYSARYAGDGVDRHNCELLLKNLKGKRNRKAEFTCCMVLYYPNGEIISATGISEGRILEDFCGDNGFGYDPIFYSNELKKCFGMATAEEKNSVSHRFKALKGLKEKLCKNK